jgi:cobalamin biosynthesis Mg chelatase CobN
MGVAASKNESVLTSFTEGVTENINSSLIQIAQSSISSAAPTQIITLKLAATGAVTISGITQKTIINVDAQQFLTNVTETSLKSMMKSAVETTATDDQSVDSQLTIGATASENVSVAEVRASNINRIVNSYTYSQFTSDVQSILAQQSITIEASGSTIDVGAIDQYIKIELISKQIADVMTSTFSDISTETSSKTTKDSTQSTSSGLSTSTIVIIVIIIAIVIALGVGIWFFTTLSGPAMVASGPSSVTVGRGVSFVSLRPNADM